MCTLLCLSLVPSWYKYTLFMLQSCLNWLLCAHFSAIVMSVDYYLHISVLQSRVFLLLNANFFTLILCLSDSIHRFLCKVFCLSNGYYLHTSVVEFIVFIVIVCTFLY